MNRDDLLVLSAYVKISTYRLKVVKCLLDNYVMIPTGIAECCGIRVNHISNVLRELKEHGVVMCLNEDARKGRLYRLTDEGVMLKDFL